MTKLEGLARSKLSTTWMIDEQASTSETITFAVDEALQASTLPNEFLSTLQPCIILLESHLLLTESAPLNKCSRYGTIILHHQKEPRRRGCNARGGLKLSLIRKESRKLQPCCQFLHMQSKQSRPFKLLPILSQLASCNHTCTYCGICLQIIQTTIPRNTLIYSRL